MLARTDHNCEDIIQDLNFSTVRQWKDQHPGAKTIAYFPVYAPVEIIHACGMLPVGLNGAGDQLDIQYADARFGSFICSIVKTTLEMGLTKHLAPFDGLLFSSICDSARNLCFVMKRNFPDQYIDFLHLPHNPNSEASVDFLVSEYRRLQENLEQMNGKRMADGALSSSIRLYNENRRLTRRLYDERARHPHRIRTSELYALVRAGNFLPVEEHTSLLWETIRELPSRKVRQRDSIRIIIEGSFCEQPPLDLIKILEEAGCYIIDDDFVLGSTIVAALFDQPIRLLLGRIISDDISRAWTRYLKLAIYVVGISGGVRVWSLERYISKRSPTDEILQLTRDRWLIEIYQTIMGTLQSVVWLLLVFFVFALIAYVIVRGLELRGMKVND